MKPPPAPSIHDSPRPLAGLLKAGIGSKVVLKHQEKKPLFATFVVDFQQHEKKSPIARMRYIDTLRYHKPTDEERIELNVCSAVERLNLHTLNDILTICGARKGARFKSHEIQRMIVSEKELVQLYTSLDLKDPLCFHKTANKYMIAFFKLKTLVEELKQLSGTLEIAPDTEFQLKAKHPFPDFLIILIQMYRRDCHCDDSWFPSTEQPTAPLDSIAHLASFLSFRLYTKGPLTKGERQSMAILLQIIKWPYKQSSFNTIELIDSGQTQRSCAKAIWGFLCTVRELRSIPKDKMYFTKRGATLEH